MSDNERENQQPLTEGPPDVKLYKINDPVNFRVTKANDDIRQLLNEKKLQGVVISEYICNLIRRAEGLPMPSSRYNEIPVYQPPQQKGPVSLDPEQMDELITRIIDRLNKSGVTAKSSDQAESTEETLSAEQESAEEQKKKEELRAIAADLTDWD